MPDKVKCTTCKGEGYIDALISQHDDKKETIQCPHCNGKGSFNMMTEQEERDYKENNDGDGWS